MVIGDAEKEKLGVNYAELVVVLINAVQELKIKTDGLKKKAKELHLIH